jgi:hypothetical protein
MAELGFWNMFFTKRFRLRAAVSASRKAGEAPPGAGGLYGERLKPHGDLPEN